MRRALRQSLVRHALVFSAAGAAVGCSSAGTSESQGPSPSSAANDRDEIGSVGMQLTLLGGQQVNTVSWTITGPNGASTLVQSGVLNVQNSLAVSFVVGNIPTGSGYTVTVSGSSTDGSVSCVGSAAFSVQTRATTNVSLGLQCNAAIAEAGSVFINGMTSSCAAVSALSAIPADVTVGHSVAVSGVATGPNPTGLTYAWSAPSGSFDTPAAAQASYTCAAAGPVTLTLTVADGAVFDGGTCNAALATQTVQVRCEAAIVSEAGTPVSEAGTPADAGPDAGAGTMDLSKYIRVGRFGNVGKLIVTEVAPWASSNSPYMADWFEVTNVGGAAVDMTGWKMDDNSNSFTLAVPIVGIGSVAPGQSVVLIEGTSTTAASFVAVWFNGSPPAGFVIGSYTGSGVGLSTGGDAVNLFNPSGTLIAGVQFGAATTGFTFDNAAGLATVTTLSVAGTNGAFLSPDNIETGSPGRTH